MQIKNTKIPREGSEMDLYERLEEYITPADREWKTRIKGASEKEIEELREKSGLKERHLEFPKGYLAFARKMGNDDGGLLDSRLLGIGSISDILTMYREAELNEQYREKYIYPYDEITEKIETEEKEIEDDEEEIEEEEEEIEEEERCFYFFWNEMGIWYGINLEDKKKDCIQCDGGEIISSSFEKLLFQCAVRRYESEYYPFHCGFSASQMSLERAIKLNGEEIEEVADKIIRKYDLKKAWFSNKWNIIAYSDIVTIEIDITSLNGAIYSNNEKILKEISEEILIKLGASRYTIYRG